MVQTDISSTWRSRQVLHLCDGIWEYRRYGAHTSLAGHRHCCHFRSAHIQLPYPLCISVVIYAITPECLSHYSAQATRLLPDVREQVVVSSKPTSRLARTRCSIRRRSRRRSTAPPSKIIVTSPPRALRWHMRRRRRRSSRRRRRARRPRIVASPCIHVSIVNSGLGRLRGRSRLGQVERRRRRRRRCDGRERLLRCRCGRGRGGHRQIE